ncbi:MAG TPA: hypothetical protein VHE09_05870 [Rhizomicrobium sp.]|jgi:hypothetical protein|nr:hypothetical protein [Rhizomicrobium sp.]
MNFVEKAISSLKRLGTGAYRTQVPGSHRNAAKESEYCFRAEAYAPRAVFELRKRMKTPAFCTEQFHVACARHARLRNNGSDKMSGDAR